MLTRSMSMLTLRVNMARQFTFDAQLASSIAGHRPPKAIRHVGAHVPITHRDRCKQVGRCHQNRGILRKLHRPKYLQ